VELLHIVFILALDGVELHALAALTLGKDPSVPTQQEDEWARTSLDSKEEKNFCPCWELNNVPGHQAHGYYYAD
jgi:hypothetical protein